jgi:hypothetical protein
MKSLYTKLLIITFLLIYSVTYSQNILLGLISYWNMNESGGSSLNDCISGNLADCNFSLNPDLNGRYGNSQYFSFQNKAVVDNNEIFNFPANGSFTITYWMKFTETQYGLFGGQDHIIISKGDWQTGGPYGALWASGVNGSGKVNFLLSDDTGYKIDLEGQAHYDDGKWHFVACVRDDAADESYLYADGEVVDHVHYDYSGNFTNNDKICIAHLMNQSRPEYFYMGSIDEIGIYNRALSPDEINYMMQINNGVSTICDLKSNIITIYPVPANNILNIKINNDLEESLLEIIDATGNVIHISDIKANTTEISLNISGISPGTYVCSVKNSKINRSSRFIVVK